MSDEKRIEEILPRESERRSDASTLGRGGERRGASPLERSGERSGERVERAGDRAAERGGDHGKDLGRESAREPARDQGRDHEREPVRSQDSNGAGRDAEAPTTRGPRHRVAQPDILNIDEAAELLGVSIKTFNKVLHNENMPARKIGREWKFSRQALIDWVGSGRSQEFYRESGDDDEDEREVEIKPQSSTPSERPKSRRTAGWQIEMD